MLRRLALILGVALATVPAGGAAAQAPPDPGETTAGTTTSNGVTFPYLRFTPSSYRPDQPLPLVVVVHGCQTTAQQELEITRFNELAEREGFAVLYPEVDTVAQQLPGPLNHCWRFFDPLAYFRGNNDVAAIAAMTHQAMADLAIDPERVYLVGVSAGGLMTSASAATYPEIYAAVGIVTSAGYADAPCFTTGTGFPVEASALLAFQQMGPRARVVPAIVIGSDADLAFPAPCSEKAIGQSLRTNNLVLGGTLDSPLALTPASVREEQVPDGLAYTVRTYLDPDGCVVGEAWLIHGMPHAWPGGAAYGGYSDTRAPDGAEATWAFLERYRRSETSLPCVEATGAAGPSPSPSAEAPPPTAQLAAVPPAERAPVGTSSAAALAATGRGTGAVVPALLLGAALALSRRRGWRTGSPAAPRWRG